MSTTPTKPNPPTNPDPNDPTPYPTDPPPQPTVHGMDMPQQDDL